MDMKIYFPGGKKVFAEYKGFTHQTDQPLKAGGDGSAPAPFDLFLASLGTCAGIFILGFCQKRGIDASNIEIRQSKTHNPNTWVIEQIEMEILVPKDFPEKYHQALIHSAQLCTVKKYMEEPPQFYIHTTVKS